ncbi:MAG: CAP domain-containing protein [Myxococcota bacterium]
MHWRWLMALVAGVTLCGCSASKPGAPRRALASSVQPDVHRTPESAEPQTPTGPLDREQANQYVLQLINRDRATQGLPPVAWDETAARAGQRHVEDMVRHGFTAHWGTDGSVPELRYTEAGGQHMVQENAGCFADGKQRQLDPDPRFDPEAIEKVQSAFFNEVPPNDGHRRNILKAWHTHVGVGLAKAIGSKVVCVAQEFTDHYGSYDELPREARVGGEVRVAGTVRAPAKFVGIGLARIPLPKPMEVDDLMNTSTYPIPAPYATYFPKGYKTPKPVALDGNAFSIDLALSDGGKPGLYEVSVWGEVPEFEDFVMLSLRTIRVQ